MDDDENNMVPYTPTSTPNMGMAGSTLGGGIDSELNLTPSPTGSPASNPANWNGVGQALGQLASINKRAAPMSPGQFAQLAPHITRVTVSPGT